MAVNPSATRHNTVVATSHGSRCGFPGAGDDDGAWSEALSSPSSAKAKSVAVWKRAAGTFSRHRSTMRTRVAGIWRSLAGRSRPILGQIAPSRRRPRCSRETRAGPTAFRTTTPRRRRCRSVRRDSGPRTCSGDMYPTVPRTTPGSVCRRQQAQLASSFWGLSRARESEVENLRALVCRNEDVRRLQVAMEESFLMSRGKAVGYLHDTFDGPAHRQRSAPQPRGERLPIEQFGDEVGRRPRIVPKT